MKTDEVRPFKVMEWLEAVQAEIYDEIKDLSLDEELAYWQASVADGPLAELWASIPRIERSRLETGLRAS